MANLQRTEDGKLLVIDGKLRRECCCDLLCDSPLGCPNCGDFTPTCIEVTVSGINLCTQANVGVGTPLSCGDGQWRVVGAPTGLQNHGTLPGCYGTWRLRQTKTTDDEGSASLCVWETAILSGTGSGASNFTVFNTDTATGTTFGELTGTHGYLIRLTRTATDIEIKIIGKDYSFDHPDFSVEEMVFFEATIPSLGMSITGVSTGLETFTTSGDKTTSFKVGKEISVTGSTGNDGIYRVASSSYAGGPDETTVTVTGDVVDATADGFLNLTCDYSRETGGAGFIVSNENTVVGDCACGTEVITTAGYGGTMTINSCAQTPFSGTFGDDLFPCDQCCPCWSPPCMTNGFEIRSAVAGVSGVGKFRIPSDKTDVFIAGYSFTVKGSASNDGTYSVLSSSFAGSTTTILTNEAIPATATDSDGFINEYEMETCYEIVGYSDGMFTGCGGTCAPVSDDLDGPWVGDVYSYTGMNGSPGPKTVHEARICEWRDSKDFGHTFDSAKRLNNVTLVNSVETPAGEPEVYIHKWTFTATCSGGTVWKGHLYSPTPGGIYTRDGFVPGCATGPTTVTLAGCGATDPGSICQCNHHPPTTLSDPTFDCGPLSDCYGISGYSSSFFTLCGSSSCDGTSVQCDANGGTTPEWDGNFDYPQSGCRWRHINGGVGGPISFPICVNGSRATLQLRLIPAQVGSVDSAGGPYWELSVRCVAAADVWTGRKIITASTPDTPAGVYTKNSGCDATGSVTLVACP